MLETQRMFRYTHARIFLVILAAVGLLLFASNQLNGEDPDDFLAQTQAFQVVCLKENKEPSDLDSISRQRQEKSILTALSNPNSFMYDAYYEMYPEYRMDSVNVEEQKTLRNDEIVYIMLEQQAAYHLSFRERISHMEEEYLQKSSSRLFRNRQDIIKQMEITLLDYQRQASAELTYGDDRFLLSVLQNKYNAALILIVAIYGCYQLFLRRESPLQAVIISTQRGRRWLMRSKLISLYIWTVISMLAILVPQFIASFFLYDGAHQWSRFIQSVQYFSDFVIPCRLPLFILLCIGYAMALACSVCTLVWAIFTLVNKEGTALLILGVLVWISYIGYNIAGNDRNYIFKYCNLISLLVPYELLSQYRLVAFAGMTINAPLLILIVCLLLSCFLGTVVWIKAAKPYPHSGEEMTGKIAGKMFRNKKNIMDRFLPWEHVKMFREGKVMLCFAVALLFAFSFQMPVQNMDSVSQVKQVYYQQLKSIDFETAQILLSDRLAETKMQIETLQADINTYGASLSGIEELRQLLSQKDALESIGLEAEEMILHNQTFKTQWIFFDPYPAQALLEAGEWSSAGRWRNLVMLMLIIYISSVSIPLENSSHVYPILFSARRGIVQILRKKAITVWTEAGAIFLCFAIPETYRLLETTPVNTAVQSLQTMRECAYDLTIGGYWLLLWGCRLLFLLGISSVVLLVGFLPKTTLGGIAVGEGFFGMINLLPVLFPSWNIPFLPVTLISSCHIAWSGIAAAGVSGICLCILLLFFLQKPFIYRLIRL